MKLKGAITGVAGLAHTGDGHATDVIPIDDAYVQGLIATEEEKLRAGNWTGQSRLLTYGKGSPGVCWYLLELSSEKTYESILRRICQAVPGLFKDLPFELFYLDEVIFVR